MVAAIFRENQKKTRLQWPKVSLNNSAGREGAAWEAAVVKRGAIAKEVGPDVGKLAKLLLTFRQAQVTN